MTHHTTMIHPLHPSPSYNDHTPPTISWLTHPTSPPAPLEQFLVWHPWNSWVGSVFLSVDNENEICRYESTRTFPTSSCLLLFGCNGMWRILVKICWLTPDQHRGSINTKLGKDPQRHGEGGSIDTQLGKDLLWLGRDYIWKLHIIMRSLYSHTSHAQHGLATSSLYICVVCIEQYSFCIGFPKGKEVYFLCNIKVCSQIIFICWNSKRRRDMYKEM